MLSIFEDKWLLLFLKVCINENDCYELDYSCGAFVKYLLT